MSPCILHCWVAGVQPVSTRRKAHGRRWVSKDGLRGLHVKNAELAPWRGGGREIKAWALVPERQTMDDAVLQQHVSSYKTVLSLFLPPDWAASKKLKIITSFSIASLYVITPLCTQSTFSLFPSLPSLHTAWGVTCKFLPPPPVSTANRRQLRFIFSTLFLTTLQ